VTARTYTANSSPASATLDQIAEWIGRDRWSTGSYAFLAARIMERDGLGYRTVFDRVVRAAVDAGLSEAAARTEVFRGFAYAAAGHPEPPPALCTGDD
jgi:hypothetical protein